MEIIWNVEPMEACVLVLGMFDGVHRGHQELLMQGAEQAGERKIPLVVWTFEPHPLEVLCPEKAPRRLTTLQERAEYMAGYGVDRLCVTRFDREVAATQPQTFLENMQHMFHPACLICGFNYSFGQGGRGKPEDLSAYGREHGAEVTIVPPVEIAGDTVSSTRIRLLLEEGQLRLASRLLGHAYGFAGRPEDGGQYLRFAWPKEKVLPAAGAYAGYIREKGKRSRPCLIRLEEQREGEADVSVLEDGYDLQGREAGITFMDILRKGGGADQEDIQLAQAWFRAHR